MGRKASLRWLIPVASAALGLGLAVPVVHAAMPGGPPEWPSLSVTGHTVTTVSLDWLDAVDDVAVDHYVVWRGDASYQNWAQVATVGAATSYWTDTQLTPSTTYTYTVRAWDAAGQESVASNHVIVTTDASPPPPSGDRPSVDPNTPVYSFTRKVFFDEFDGTLLDTTKWRPYWFREGGTKNNVHTYAANVTVSNGAAHLKLASTSSGAMIRTDYWDPRTYKVAVGDYVEARVYFPGNANDQAYNWPGFWINGTANWPYDGEHDVAEGLGALGIVYHGNGVNTTPYFPPGHWVNGWHVFGLHRKAGSADVYWDGRIVRSYTTRDSGALEEVIFNIGQGQGGPTVVGLTIDVDWVRAWRP